MTQYFGDFSEDATVYIPFNTFSSDDPSASVTITDLADADIKVHKNGSATEIVTDGATVAINFNTITGNHLITIDTSAHTDYSTGADYLVRIEGTTVDGATINAWVGSFSIQNRFMRGTDSAYTGTPPTASAIVDEWETQSQADPTGFHVNVKEVNGTAQTANDNSADINAILEDTGTTLPAAITAAAAEVSVDEIQASALADLFNTDSGTTYAAAVAGSVAKEIADNAGGSALTESGIADAVWDEVLSGHTTAGTTGAALSDAGSAGDPWSTALPGAYGSGTAGKILGDNLNAPVGTVDTVVDAIKAVTDNLPNSGALTSLAQASVCTEARLSELDAATAGKMANQVDIIQTDTTTDIPGTITTLQGNVTDILADTADIQPRVVAIETDTSTTLEGHLTDIKGATFAGATDSLEAIRNRGDAAWITADVSGVSTHSAADVKTAIEAGGSSIAQILEDTGTTLDTLIKDVPTVAEFNARTLPSADYVVTSDTIAGVTTATNLTNAPTAGDLTAAMKASINTEVDTALDTAISSPTAGSIADYVMRMKYVICNKFTIDSDGGQSVVHNDSNTAVSTVAGAFTEASTIKTRLKVY